MVLKFLKMDEAAQKLAVSVDELNQLRESHEISGYRDGPNWKFKEADVEKLAQQLASRKAESADAEKDFDLPADDEGSGEIILVSDQELGESDPSTSSTIIGRPGAQSPEESDIRLIAPDDEQAAAAQSSDVKLVVDTASSGSDSDVKLVAEEPEEQEAAVVEVEPDAPTDLSIPSLGPSDSDIGIGTDTSASEPADLGIDSVHGPEGAEPSQDDALSLGDEHLAVADEPSEESALAPADEDEELVLGGTGSDVTLSSADSGISLGDPADSGLSLEDPLELGPSDDASLELDLDSVEVVPIDEDADSAEVVELKSEEDFELTSGEDAVAAVDDASSGSQVIELDEESPFGEEDLMGAGETTGILEEAEAVKERPAGAAAVADAAPEPSAAAAVAAEPQYSTLNILSLGICTLFLGICGTMVFDLVRNMWLWDSPYQVNSAVMDLVMGLFGG